MTRALVTGATGNVGAHAVRALRERGIAVRAFVRDAGRAAAWLGTDVELAVGDFADATSVRRALEGVERVFLACANHPRQVEYETTVIEEAAARGVERIVKLSAHGAEIGSPLAFWDWHGRIEQRLRTTALPATVLQPTSYMSNLLASAELVRHTGALYAPAQGARIAMIDPRDVAAVAAVAMTEEGHDAKTYVLSGPEAITYDEVAAHLSLVAGRAVTFVPLPDEAAQRGMVAAGMPEWLAGALVTLFAIQRQGAHAVPTETVRALAGREPRSFAEFAREHAHLFGTGDPTTAGAGAPR